MVNMLISVAYFFEERHAEEGADRRFSNKLLERGLLCADAHQGERAARSEARKAFEGCFESRLARPHPAAKSLTEHPLLSNLLDKLRSQ